MTLRPFSVINGIVELNYSIFSLEDLIEKNIK